MRAANGAAVRFDRTSCYYGMKSGGGEGGGKVSSSRLILSILQLHLVTITITSNPFAFMENLNCRKLVTKILFEKLF